MFAQYLLMRQEERKEAEKRVSSQKTSWSHRKAIARVKMRRW